MTARIIVGDALTELRKLPSESVNCCVTSPPYWGLRDYGVAGQIGLEPTIGAYVDKMVAVFQEVRRVLRGDGTLWLNLGDSYSGGKTGRDDLREFAQSGGIGNSKRPQDGQKYTGTEARQRLPSDGLKPKDICGIPWRVAFAMQADGWWLRQDIIWHKPNPMPESVTDRCTKSHEYVFLLSKSDRYWYDGGAIAEPVAASSLERWNGGVARTNPSPQGLNVGPVRGENSCGVDVENGRNKRSVWTVATQPYSEAHFATFPPKLIEPCILAGCPLDGTVLDPFGGAGTTGLVADRLQRHSILIELNPTYAEMARKRIYNDAPIFADLPAEAVA